MSTNERRVDAFIAEQDSQTSAEASPHEPDETGLVAAGVTDPTPSQPARSTVLEKLERSECLRLLRTVPVGRVAFIINAMPSVHPVNFVLHDDQIVFRTGRGSKLAAALHSTVVAFEVDEYDSAQHVGWSVTAVGRSSVVTDPERRRQLAELPLRPWAPGDRDHFIVINTSTLQGRRIVSSMAEGSTS